MEINYARWPFCINHWPTPDRPLVLLPLNEARHCDILERDLVKIRLVVEYKLHLPGYIVAVDHATRSVVLSVRGTSTMQDTVTNLICDSAGESSLLFCEPHLKAMDIFFCGVYVARCLLLASLPLTTYCII